MIFKSITAALIVVGALAAPASALTVEQIVSNAVTDHFSSQFTFDGILYENYGEASSALAASRTQAAGLEDVTITRWRPEGWVLGDATFYYLDAVNASGNIILAGDGDPISGSGWGARAALNSLVTEVFEAGFDDGYQNGYENGYEEGYQDGYNEGWYDGFDTAIGYGTYFSPDGNNGNGNF